MDVETLAGLGLDPLAIDKTFVLEDVEVVELAFPVRLWFDHECLSC